MRQKTTSLSGPGQNTPHNGDPPLPHYLPPGTCQAQSRMVGRSGPFSRTRGGVSREDISSLLKLGSVALEYPPDLIGSHSLRKEGATALYAATGDMERSTPICTQISTRVSLMPVTCSAQSPPCNHSRDPEARPRQEGNRGERSRGMGCRAGYLDVVSGGSPPLIRGVVLACPTVGGHAAHCDHRNSCKQGCGRRSPDVRSICSNCHGCAHGSVASCAGCACPTVCRAVTCNARAHFRIGCSTPSVQASSASG